MSNSSQFTMAEVEWDDDLHYLAEAEHAIFGKVIMLRLNAHNPIDFIAPECYASRFKDTSPGNLTPTGRRYTLTEVQDIDPPRGMNIVECCDWEEKARQVNQPRINGRGKKLLKELQEKE